MGGKFERSPNRGEPLVFSPLTTPASKLAWDPAAPTRFPKLLVMLEILDRSLVFLRRFAA